MLVIAAALPIDGCGGTGGGDRVVAATAELRDFTGDSVVVQWNAIAVQTIGTMPPLPSSRAMAAVQGAVFEAVNSITGKYDPYFATTLRASAGANPDAAAIAAAHGVLTWLLPAEAATLLEKRESSLATISDGQGKTDGIAAGEAAAAAMIAARTGDGSTPPLFWMPPSSAPYEWQTTPTCPPAGGLFYHWPKVKPYGIQSSSQFRATPPPSLDSGEYAKAYNEVRAVGYVGSPQRPQDRADVARVYAAQPAHQGWNDVARQILATRHDSITDTARTLAVMNMTLSDGFITVFESKYFYRTWRPETAIVRGDEDGNPATVAAPFTPFVVTPCFPGYPSAHGSGAGGASRILAKAYGRFHSVELSHLAVPGVVLHYDDLKDIVSDISDARVYGGIHFRFDQDAAEAMGRDVANYNNSHILRERGHQDQGDADDDDDNDVLSDRFRGHR
jgi:hypothetical protein